MQDFYHQPQHGTNRPNSLSPRLQAEIQVPTIARIDVVLTERTPKEDACCSGQQSCVSQKPLFVGSFKTLCVSLSLYIYMYYIYTHICLYAHIYIYICSHVYIAPYGFKIRNLQKQQKQCALSMKILLPLPRPQHPTKAYWSQSSAGRYLEGQGT